MPQAKQPRHPEAQSNLQPSSEADPDPDPEPLCEFTNTCTTNTKSSQSQSRSQSQDPTSPSAPATTSIPSSKNPRKVISHIFGRNKTATKLFPPQVWVHYCRKHYQRARYRSREWPFTQCDLLLDSLRRMEAWGGVAGFGVILRRREVERIEGEGEGDAGRGMVRRGLRSGSGMAGNVRAGRTDSNANADGHANARVNSTARAQTRPRSFSYSRTENDNADEDYDDSPSTAQTRSKPKGVQNKRKRPVIEAAPVPAWLREEVGASKSFDDVRGIIYRLQDHLTRLHDEGRLSEIRFPDIEILPSFQNWVLDKAADTTARANKQRRGANSGGGGGGGGQRRG